MINIGVIGYGYWGPNIVRNFSRVKNTRVAMICDTSGSALEAARRDCPGAEMTQDYREITDSPKIDAIAIITPVNMHYEIAKRALEQGKHVFVEKPFTATSRQAETLIELGEKKKLLVMVDHTFLFTSAVRKIENFVKAGELGDLLYYDSTRINLGLFQKDINVIWDLAPHDFSILTHVIPGKPTALSAHGIDHFKTGLANVAYVTVFYGDGFIAHFNFNWLSPVKVRKTLIGGTKKLLMWDDLDADEKIKIYDKGVDVRDKDQLYKLLISYRSGDIYSPKLEKNEALETEISYFSDCLSSNEKPLNDGSQGLAIVRLLEACDMSLSQNGKLVDL
jgi:predicted dehydrogenase